jgi:hypothetical protein
MNRFVEKQEALASRQSGTTGPELRRACHVAHPDGACARSEYEGQQGRFGQVAAIDDNDLEGAAGPVVEDGLETGMQHLHIAGQRDHDRQFWPDADRNPEWVALTQNALCHVFQKVRQVGALAFLAIMFDEDGGCALRDLCLPRQGNAQRVCQDIHEAVEVTGDPGAGCHGPDALFQPFAKARAVAGGVAALDEARAMQQQPGCMDPGRNHMDRKRESAGRDRKGESMTSITFRGRDQIRTKIIGNDDCKTLFAIIDGDLDPVVRLVLGKGPAGNAFGCCRFKVATHSATPVQTFPSSNTMLLISSSNDPGLLFRLSGGMPKKPDCHEPRLA